MKPETGCAQRLEQVLMAWGLVYRRYVDMGLVDENPVGIHTVPEAIGEDVCVVYQALRGEVVTTVTVIADSADRLPLDSVYGEALNDLRHQGRTIAEIGLMADRRREIQRAAGALFEIMCCAGYYALHLHYSDIVVGVHPHHVAFYRRCFGFEVLDEQKQYPTVNHHPVVPLCLQVRDMFEQSKPPPGFRHAHDYPVSAENFIHRFKFEPAVLRGSPIERSFQG